MTSLLTMPLCGHKTINDGCVHCLAHQLDLIRHVERTLRKHLSSKRQRVTEIKIVRKK